MKRVRRLLEPERPRPVAGPVLTAILLLAPIAVGLSAWQAKPPAPAPTTPVKRAALPVQIAQAEQVARPLPEKLRNAPDTPYRKWVTEDVAYIITNEERAAFERLQTNEEREKFIEQFWERRDPTPGTVENEFKEEHYRRIAFANQHFAEGVPGWKTDRGRIYIMYGPPDEIDSRRAGPAPTDTYPVQQWRYRFIEGIGNNVIIEFVDTTGKGEFHMTMDPSEKERLLHEPAGGAGRADQQSAPMRNLVDLDNQITMTEDLLAFIKRTFTDGSPQVRETQTRLEALQRMRDELADRIARAH